LSESKDIHSAGYLRNIVTMMAGSGVATIIPIVLSLVLTRLYSPENYGSFSIFLSTAGLLSMLVTIQYCSAILFPGKDCAASQVALLSLLVTLVVAVTIAVSFVILAVWDMPIMRHGWLLPISLIVSGCNATLRAWSSRLKRYRVSSLSKIVSVLAAGAVQIIIGSIYPSSFGLIVGYVCGQIAMAGVFLWGNQILIKLIYENIPSAQQLRTLGQRYRSFLLFATPSAIVESAIANLPIYAFALFYTESDIGFLGLALRILLGPVNVLSQSVGQVFQQKAVEDVRESGGCRLLFRNTLTGLSLIGLPGFAVLFAFGPDLFSFAFGEGWAMSGEFARPLAVLFCVKFVTGPLLFVFYITNRQKQFLIFNIGTFLFSCLGILFTASIDGGALTLIVVYSITSSVGLLVLLLLAYHYSGDPLPSAKSTP
jgi:O-antigen/teichoic acid export membrane protein